LFQSKYSVSEHRLSILSLPFFSQEINFRVRNQGPGIRNQAYCKTAQSQLIWQNTNSLNTNKLYLLKIRLRGLSWLRWLRGCNGQGTGNVNGVIFSSYSNQNIR